MRVLSPIEDWNPKWLQSSEFLRDLGAPSTSSLPYPSTSIITTISTTTNNANTTTIITTTPSHTSTNTTSTTTIVLPVLVLLLILVSLLQDGVPEGLAGAF